MDKRIKPVFLIVLPVVVTVLAVYLMQRQDYLNSQCTIHSMPGGSIVGKYYSCPAADADDVCDLSNLCEGSCVINAADYGFDDVDDISLEDINRLEMKGTCSSSTFVCMNVLDILRGCDKGDFGDASDYWCSRRMIKKGLYVYVPQSCPTVIP